MFDSLVRVLPENEFAYRADRGIFVPMDEDEGLKIIDCGDLRTLTEASAQQRIESHGQEVTPGRFFGGASGLALTGLVAAATQQGSHAIGEFVRDYSEDAFVDFAADLSHIAKTQGVDLTQHSAEVNEANPLELSQDIYDDGPIGCKLAALAGMVLSQMGNDQVYREARLMASSAGVSTDALKEAQLGARTLGIYLPPYFSVHRNSLSKAIASDRHTPLAILEGKPLNSEDTAVVVDFAGVRSSASTEIPRYHHSIDIANKLPEFLPEFHFDEAVLASSSLLLAAAVRRALSGEQKPYALQAEVIPAEYTNVA